jgi:hypothetical protein
VKEVQELKENEIIKLTHQHNQVIEESMKFKEKSADQFQRLEGEIHQLNSELTSIS